MPRNGRTILLLNQPMERKSVTKQSVCYYLCIASAALAMLMGACFFALVAAHNSLGLGLGLSLFATLLAAVAYANALPLNRARCTLWFAFAIAVFACYLVLFVLYDLAKLPVAIVQEEGRLVFNAMAIVGLVFASLCLAGLVFLAVRAVLLALGRYATDTERRAAREAETAAAPAEVRPRAIDNDAVVAQAQQEIDANRMVVEEDTRPLVTPDKARKAAGVSKRPAPVVMEQQPQRVEIEPEPLVLSAPIASPTPEIADADSLLAQEEVSPDQDIRAESATHHIRQPLQEKGNDLYNNFSYSSDDNDD